MKKKVLAVMLFLANLSFAQSVFNVHNQQISIPQPKNYFVVTEDLEPEMYHFNQALSRSLMNESNGAMRPLEFYVLKTDLQKNRDYKRTCFFASHEKFNRGSVEMNDERFSYMAKAIPTFESMDWEKTLKHRTQKMLGEMESSLSETLAQEIEFPPIAIQPGWEIFRTTNKNIIVIIPTQLGEYSILSAVSILHLKGKMFNHYCYAETHHKKQLQTTIAEWADALIQENQP